MNARALACLNHHTQANHNARVAQYRAAVDDYKTADSYADPANAAIIHAHGLAGIVELNQEHALLSARLRKGLCVEEAY